MTRAELVERFTLERVNRSPGVFDAEKLEWLNGEHLRALSAEAFADAMLEHLEWRGSPLAAQPERVAQAAPLVQEKMRVLDQFERLCGFLFGPVERRRRRMGEGRARRPSAARSLRRCPIAAGGGRRLARRDRSRRALRAACEREGLKPRVLFMPVRVAITGSTVSPGLYESLELVGRERESLRRIDAALANLGV